MFDEFGNPMGDFYEMGEDLGYDGYDASYPSYPNFPMNDGMNYNGYKPMRATNRNVQDVIAMNLGCDPFLIDFVKLDDLPPVNNWKHSCYRSGVTLMNVNQFVFDDGSVVYFAVCPFFPECNKVHYYVEKF